MLSKTIERKVRYDLSDSGELKVHNPLEIEVLYRYPDLTIQTVFLARVIQTTIIKDIPVDLLFLQCYDELKSDIQSIVDMPYNKLDRMIIFLHQNKGKLATRKRKFVPELSETEIRKMEVSYDSVFE